MKSESPIDMDFFNSSEFAELLISAKKFQLENAKNKITDFNNPQNPLMKEIFGGVKPSLNRATNGKLSLSNKNHKAR